MCYYLQIEYTDNRMIMCQYNESLSMTLTLNSIHDKIILIER